MFAHVHAHIHRFMGAHSSRTTVDEMSSERVPAYSCDPDKAWSILSVKRKVDPVTPLDPTSPKPPGHTRFVCISGEEGGGEGGREGGREGMEDGREGRRYDGACRSKCISAGCLLVLNVMSGTCRCALQEMPT